MFKKILVCLDGSELAEKVLHYATEEAEHFDSDLVLYMVISERSIMSPGVPGFPGVSVESTGMEKRVIEDEKEAGEYLKSMADKLQAENKLRVAYDTTRGIAGPAIVEYCVNQDIDLIAIATHGRSGPGRVLLGSVADYVIRHSHLPILLIRPTKDKSK